MSTQVYDDRQSGWLQFTAVVLFAVGFFRIISAIGYFADSHKVNNLTNGLFSGSLKNLDTSVKTLTGLDPNTATKTEYQTDVQAVQNDWATVKSDAQNVQSAQMGSFDSAWDSFDSAVKNVPNDASVSDALSSITASAQTLVSTAESTASSLNCS